MLPASSDFLVTFTVTLLTTKTNGCFTESDCKVNITGSRLWSSYHIKIPPIFNTWFLISAKNCSGCNVANEWSVYSFGEVLITGGHSSVKINVIVAGLMHTSSTSGVKVPY